ncbi:MAG: hypothetical protein K2I07_07605 [Lachnospiraceae bacterium]|nr:hypothetical protein [Lachnospiraceae bacterium]
MLRQISGSSTQECYRSRNMAGISILLANLWLGIILISTLIAFVFFIVSFILFLKKKKKQRIAIVLAVLGFVFLLPLGMTLTAGLIFSGKENAERRQYIESIENKIYVQEDEWKKGFTYDGKELVPVNLLMNDDRFELVYLGALVIEKSDRYYSFYQVENDSGYEIYYVKVTTFVGGEYYSRTFVNQNDYDAVVDYYDNSELAVSALWTTMPDNILNRTWKRLQIELEDRHDELLALSHEVLDDISDKKVCNTSRRGYDENIFFRFQSGDGVYRVELCIYTSSEEMVLFLNEYKVESEIVEKYKDMLFALIQDAQTQLWQIAQESAD